jgi:hypothetical protein
VVEGGGSAAAAGGSCYGGVPLATRRQIELQCRP